jgi:lysophospholipase L1-like esterase
MRYEASEAVGSLQAHGDKNLHYVDGLPILGPEEAHTLPDDGHPDAEGYKFMGRRFLEEVAVPLFKGRSRA